ncbi:MAG: hypothetical protein H7Y61_13780 [Rhizobiales bacterium]|nr:hypothetical protein [Rhizobacter sp.]
MNPWVGWGLALAAVVAGWFGYGWPGLALAITVIVFWLLIQFSRSVRVMRDAADAPIGHVPSAVMLHAKLRAGLPMLQIVTLTKSLGRQVSESPEVWAWGDESGAEVRIVFAGGRCTSWTLTRPAEAATA